MHSCCLRGQPRLSLWEGTTIGSRPPSQNYHLSVRRWMSRERQYWHHCRPFSPLLNSSLCIVDFDRIKRYIPKNITGIRIQGDALDDNTIGIGLRNLSCSLRHENTLRLKLLNCSCLPDKGKIIWQKPKRIV